MERMARWTRRQDQTRASAGGAACLLGMDVLPRGHSARSVPRARAPSAPAATMGEAAVGAASPLATRLARMRGPGAMDYGLLLAVAGLLLLGLVMVYSASQLAMPGDPSFWLRRQALWAAIGTVALLVCARVDYHLWRRVAFAAMLLSAVLVLLVLRQGYAAYGGQRWLRLGISFQPSELAKLALAIYMADWLVRKGSEVRSALYGLAPFVVLVGGILLLILLENDLGTSVVIAIMALAVFFVAGANLIQLAPVVLLGIFGGLVLVVGTGFRRARLVAFLHPLAPGCGDAASYQVCQGLISLGSGGLFGRGLGDSLQKAGYLPNPYTDSIFAVTGEELGLVGCGLILALFAALAWRGFRAGRRAPDAYGALLACGITTWICAQAALNIGSVTAAIPFTGVPLPFISFGGSSLVTALAGIGILLNISRQAAPRNLPTCAALE